MKLGTLCYIRSGGRTLMVHRDKRPGDMHWGKWNGLGGKVIPGETPEECVIREVREESGLELACPRLCGILTFPAFDDEEDWYVFVFEAMEFGGDLSECPEGTLEWIEDDRLPGLDLWEGDRLFLPWIGGGRFFSGRLAYSAGRLVDHSVVFYSTNGGLSS
jgi:8-oxo-dGTP diphosphatase